MLALWPYYQISLNSQTVLIKIQIRFHWSAQQTTQYTDSMVYFLGQLSSAPIDQTSSAHPTSDGKYALSALRLTRPDLHSSIAGNYALPALVTHSALFSQSAVTDCGSY